MDDDAQFVAELVHEALATLKRGEPFDRTQIDPENASVRIVWRGVAFVLTAKRESQKERD